MVEIGESSAKENLVLVYFNEMLSFGKLSSFYLVCL